MIKTPELELVCAEISKLGLDWDRIADGHSLMYTFSKRRTIHELIKQFSEIHLDLCLETISANSNVKIKFNQLPKKETPKNVFAYDCFGRLHARFKNPKDGQDFEYDTVVTVCGIPVDFEITLKKHQRGARFGKKMNTNGKLTPRFYERKLAPLMELFDSDVGYVFVMPQDVYRDHNQPGRTTADNFKRNNGLLAQLPFTAQEFRVQACREALERELINPLMINKNNFQSLIQPREYDGGW